MTTLLLKIWFHQHEWIWGNFLLDKPSTSRLRHHDDSPQRTQRADKFWRPQPPWTRTAARKYTVRAECSCLCPSPSRAGCKCRQIRQDTTPAGQCHLWDIMWRWNPGWNESFNGFNSWWHCDIPDSRFLWGRQLAFCFAIIDTGLVADACDHRHDAATRQWVISGLVDPNSIHTTKLHMIESSLTQHLPILKRIIQISCWFHNVKFRKTTQTSDMLTIGSATNTELVYCALAETNWVWNESESPRFRRMSKIVFRMW